MWIRQTLLTIFTAFALVWGVEATATLVLGPDDADWTDNSNSFLDSSDLETITGISGLLKAYKAESDPTGEEGPFASSYETTFSNTSTDPEDALIEWIGPSVLNCPECILVVKDGDTDPSNYLFDIGSWNGMESIDLQGFWPNSGAISNVTIWSTDVPEPGTLSLMVIGTFGILLFTRRRRVVSA